jgi:epoxyqueuosine reductase
MNARTVSLQLKARAYALGFDLCGIATLGPMPTAPMFKHWIDEGYAGDMTYLERGAHKRQDSSRPFAGTVSALVVALNYGGREPGGPVARYARGDDYHEIIEDRLNELLQWLRETHATDVRGKPYVDTGPILERDLARQAGLGWFGKNTNLIHPKLGSFFFLAALVVDLPLVADEPFISDHCGTCTRCLDACPTDAFVDARVLDATRCISYLTIELKGDIPLPLRPAMGDLIYGCDICQDVCPWNEKFSQPLREAAFAPRDVLESNDPRTIARKALQLTQDDFTALFRNSPIKRTKLRGLKRNAAVVLGNIGETADQDILEHAVRDAEPVVREHAAWAVEAIRRRNSQPGV